jgi:hypothetical protein
MILFSLVNAPADTNGYYIAGYAIFFIVMILYLGSIFIRDRNLKQEYELLVELDQER